MARASSPLVLVVWFCLALVTAQQHRCRDRTVLECVQCAQWNWALQCVACGQWHQVPWVNFFGGQCEGPETAIDLGRALAVAAPQVADTFSDTSAQFTHLEGGQAIGEYASVIGAFLQTTSIFTKFTITDCEVGWQQNSAQLAFLMAVNGEKPDVLHATEACCSCGGGSNRSAEYDQTTRNALTALFNETDGPNWTRTFDLLPSWNFSNSFCTWEYVRCNSNGDIFMLTLALSGARGTLPSQLAQLTSLKSIVSVGNQLSGTLPFTNTANHLNTVGLMDFGDFGNLPSISGTLPSVTQSVVIIGDAISGTLPRTFGPEALCLIAMYNLIGARENTKPQPLNNRTLSGINRTESNNSHMLPCEMGAACCRHITSISLWKRSFLGLSGDLGATQRFNPIFPKVQQFNYVQKSER